MSEPAAPAGTPTRIQVGGSAPYDVWVGHGVRDRLPELLGRAERVAVIFPAALADAAARAVEDVAASGRAAHPLEIPDGESAKDLAVAGRLWDALGRFELTRSDAVVGIGGGATTDVAGFVAATWLRGIRVVHLATTLLGMVDAAVGGKTAINVAAGKNLVGSFHPPGGVLADLDFLATLPAAEMASGMAEVVKAGWIADPVILDLVAADPAATLRPDSAVLGELVVRAIAVKAEVVTADLREAGRREFLNYGHTLGHAIERVENFRWRHGAAISVGMCFAAALARETGRLDAATVARHRQLLEAIDLPTTYHPDAWPALHEAMRIDKKARGARLRFVVLDRVGAPAILEHPDPELLERAYAEVAG